MSVGFVGGLRAGEWKQLKWNNCKWLEDDEGPFVRFTLRKQKTMLHTERKIVDIVNTKNMRPFDYFLAWWKHHSKSKQWKPWLAAHGDELVFPNLRGGQLSSRHTRPFFNFYAVLNGCDPKGVNCHSLRIGSTTQMSIHNASDRMLKVQGRWNSEQAFQRYVRPDYRSTCDVIFCLF